MSITVRRRDIRLEEQEEDAWSFYEAPGMVWVARFNGNLSSGESALLERSGNTAAEAYDALEAAILEQGWTIA